MAHQVTRLADWSRSQALERPATGGAVPSSFGSLLRSLRVTLQVSQNEVARRAHVDTAYVWRLERAASAPPYLSREVVLSLANAVNAEADDRDRLLAAAGLLPETVLEQGGWDEYLRGWRGQVATLERKLELRDAHIGDQARRLLAACGGSEP
jgi:transcriptional regulator with XRE-family HTH domain